MTADKNTYLRPEAEELQKIWPENRTITIVCHGHSIPCGYMAQNVTSPFDAYPHLLHKKLAERFPHSVINVIVTAIGGENAVQGALRFQEEVLNHKPDLILIDYGRNDMFLQKTEMRRAWCSMIEMAKEAGKKVILLTPAPDAGTIYYEPDTRKMTDGQMRDLICELADQYEVGLADVCTLFEHLFEKGHQKSEYAASVNHPNRRAHEKIAECLMEWIPYI